ncbi:ABC transporter substrate-binding protein [uncultured Pseudodesulfovibrio sp.]|uniref:ABC transporter substrate-binding protein n=1 Tax=uncultured Pseudodesulfovibrio sp. TaxID=2035858 RepID=UPI0029C762D9|nr:ABC transporter substrate-binding protein [uncultured Pseudodesulfovibrio sp.]
MTRLKKMTQWFTVILLSVLFMPVMATAATPLTFWTTEVTADRQAVIKYLADVFMILNPDVEVRVVGIEENSIVDALTQAQKNGVGPEIVSCASDLLISFSECGWVNNQGTERCISTIGRDRFYSGTLDRLRLADGRYGGIPFNGWIQGIWYRKDWFNERGLKPPTSWNNIIKAAKEFHAPEAGRYGILIGTQADAYAEQVFTHLALSAGVQEFTPTGKVIFDTPEAVRTLKFYIDLAQYSPPGPQTWRGRDFYFQGKLAMMFYSTFIMDDLAIPYIAADSLTGNHFEELSATPYDHQLLKHTGFVSSITGTQKTSYGVINALGLLRTDKGAQEKAAERFVQFLFTKDAYISWLHMVPGGMMPTLRDIASQDTFFRDQQGVFQRYSRQRIQSILSGFDSLKSFSFVNGRLMPKAAQVSAKGLLAKMIKTALQGKKTPEEAISQTAEAMRTIDSDL